MIAHAELEVAIESIAFRRDGLLKLFRGQCHVFVKQVLIFVFHRLPKLAVGAPEIIRHVVGWATRNLREFEVVDRFSIVFVVQVLEPKAISRRRLWCLHKAGTDRAWLDAGSYRPCADGRWRTRRHLCTHLRWYDCGSLQERLAITFAEFGARTIAIPAFGTDDFVPYCR